MTAPAQSNQLHFQSGFEAGTQLVNHTASGADIIGIDASVGVPNDWVSDLEGADFLCPFHIQYQGGHDTMRLAEIATDPMDPSNKVLHFWIKHPNVNNEKGRVQGNIYNCQNGPDSLFYSIKLLLPDDIDTLRYLPATFSFFTLMEFWNNPGWLDSTSGFRITVNLQKTDVNSSKLHLGVHGQTYDKQADQYNDLWDTVNTHFDVPTSKWLELQVGLVEGRLSMGGKFLLIATPQGAASQTLYDIEVDTHHPSAIQTDGITHFNPFKLYTNDAMINTLRSLGKMVHVFWDDFRFYRKAGSIDLEELGGSNDAFRIFPNPSGGVFSIESSDVMEIRSLQLFDMTGKELESVDGVQLPFRMELKNVKRGIYLLIVTTTDGEIYHRKIQIL